MGGAAIKVSGDALKDPRFRKVIDKLKASSDRAAKHPPAGQKAAEAQAAAQSPPNEQVAGARANQVSAVKEAEGPKPQKNEFLELLRAQIEQAMPKTLDDADHFMKGGEKEEIRSAVSGNVQQQSQAATGPTQQAANAPPDTASVPARAATAMKDEAQPPLPQVIGAEGMPEPKPQAEVQKLSDAPKEADKQLQDAKVTPQQLQKANDPRFSAVLSERSNVQKVAAAAPNRFRAQEQGTLSRAANLANADARTGVASLGAVRGRQHAHVKSRQQLARERDEKRRKEVADRIQSIFDKTKQNVDAKLASLETDVMAMFDAGADAALNTMKEWSNQKIDDYKDDRYSGITGKGRWIADLFRDTPQGIKDILKQARGVFTSEMDKLVVRVSALVEQRLAEAKAEVGKGEAEIKGYVASLPRDLQAVGRAAQQQVQERFNELRQGIDDKKNDLAQKLAQKYKEAHDKADEALKKLEEENAGALKKFADAVVAVIKAILEFKEKLMAVLKKGADAIGLILDDPIGFLGNLLRAIKQGFNQFVGNIWEHLKAGFMKFLFGSLAETGVEVPADLSLPSILKLVLQILGLTWDRIRAKAVKLLGERTVSLLEKLYEYIQVLIQGGPAALWEKVKEDLANLKQMAIDAIQDWLITTIIKAAITKLVSMFNPVGAIIQAVITIYNVVMFVVERAQQIMALIEAIVNSISAIASGAIDSAANWIEQALARFVPVVIALLARLLGVSGITEKIKQIILKVQSAVDKAIDKVIAKIVGFVKKLFGRGEGKKEEGNELPKEKVEKSVDMAGEGHHVYADTETGEIEISFASALQKRLSAALPAAKTEVNGAAKGTPIYKNKAAIVGVLSKAEADSDKKKLKADWKAGSRGKTGDPRLYLKQFLDRMVVPVVADLKKLSTYNIKALDHIVGPVPSRQLPNGYDVRAKLYERGSSWKSERADWLDNTAIPALKKKIKAIVNGPPSTLAARRGQLINLILNGKAPKHWEPAFDNGKLKDTWVDNVAWDVDHAIPLAQHWQTQGYKVGDAPRWAVCIDRKHFDLLTASANRSKGGGGFTYAAQPAVNQTFTSIYAEGGAQSARTIDDKPFLDAATKKPIPG